MYEEIKYKVINELYDCKTFEKFTSIIENFNSYEKLYAQCYWICKKYRYEKIQDDRLNKLASKYYINLDEIKKFVKNNPKETYIDYHISNIIKLDIKFKNEKNILDRIDYIGKDAINIVPIDNPTLYKGYEEDSIRFSEGYKYKYEKFHLEKESPLDNSFGHYLNVKIINEPNRKLNKIILSKKVVEDGLFNVTIQTQIINRFDSSMETTNDLPYYELPSLDNLDEYGIIKVGSEINDGDILIGCLIFDKEAPLLPEEKLLRAIFGEKARPILADVSIINKGQHGVVSNVSIDRNNGIKTISITIDNCIGLELGDELGDIKYNKGKIVEIISCEEMKKRYGKTYDIVTNYQIDNYILRFNPIVADSISYCNDDDYNIYQEPLVFNKIIKPLIIDENILNKFYKYNLIDCLIEMINYSKGCSYENTISAQIINNENYILNKNDIRRINYLKNYFLILGFKIDIYENVIKLKKLTDEDVQQISYGEVTKGETLNYRTSKPEPGGLFCEKIFGPQNNYKCYCEKFYGVRFKDTKCDKCGVEITLNDKRFVRCGHINLTDNINSIFGENIQKLIVIPPEVRPCFKQEGKFYSDKTNDYYKFILNRLYRLKKFIENNQLDYIKSEIDFLQKNVIELQDNTLRLIVNKLKSYAKKKISFSIKCVCSIDNNLSNSKCLIPERALFTLLKPYIIRVLAKENNCTPEIALKKYMINKSNIIELIKSIINNKKILLFSNSKDGCILQLDMGITKGNSIILTEENYNKLCPNDNMICGLIPMTNNCKNYINENINLLPNSNNISSNAKIEDTLINKILLEDNENKCIKFLKEYLKENKEIKLETQLEKFIIKTIT